MVLRIEKRFTAFCISTEKETNTIFRWFFGFAMKFASFHLFSAIVFFQLKQLSKMFLRQVWTNFNFMSDVKIEDSVDSTLLFMRF